MPTLPQARLYSLSHLPGAHTHHLLAMWPLFALHNTRLVQATTGTPHRPDIWEPTGRGRSCSLHLVK
jgi:hypothetical protein